MNNYKVSIIIPCYNIENIVSEKENPFKLMIKSIINQTIGFENIEVLLVDDCSTDNTPNLLKELHKKYSNIKPIFLEKNSGRPAIPRNIGIKYATANYICFLDQDDRMNLDCLEILYNEIINNAVDIVKSNYSILMGDDILNYDTGKNEYLIITPKSKDCIYLNYHIVWASLYRRDFILKNNIYFPNVSLGEDLLFVSNCINSTKKNIITMNNYYSVIYTTNNFQSISHQFSISHIDSLIRVYSLILDSYIENKQHKAFIKSNLEFIVTLLIGTLMRSNENNSNKKLMAKKIKSFLIKYNHIDIRLPKHWDISRKLIINNHYNLINLMSNFINIVFERKWFIRLFRNQKYKN